MLPELSFSDVEFLNLFRVIILNTVEGILIEAQFLLKKTSFMSLGLENVAEERETVCLNAFVTLLIEIAESLIAGSLRLVIDDIIILLPDFEDGTNNVLVDHRIDIVVDTVHQFVQSLVFRSSDFFLQFFVLFNHCFFHHLLFVQFVPQSVAIKILENFQQ